MYLPFPTALPQKPSQRQHLRLCSLLCVLTTYFLAAPAALAEIKIPQNLATSSQVIETTASDKAETQYLENMLQLLKPAYAQLGISVWDMTTQQAVFTYNDQSLMQPASIQKLLTALAATKQLGPDFYYQTQLSTYHPTPLTKQMISNGVYGGDIYVEFSGDPTLTYQNLFQLLTSLRDLGIKKIDGQVVLVSDQDSQLQAPGWVWDDLGICYAAPISPFIIDKNCVYGRLSTKGYNKTAQITLMGKRPIDISNDAYFINPTVAQSQHKAAPAGSVYTQANSQPACQLTLNRFDNNRYHLTGCHVGAKSLPLAIAITHPALYAQNIVAKQLTTLGIQHNAPMVLSRHQIKPASGQRQLIASHQSVPLTALLSTMLLKSDNLIADSLLKKLGESYYQSPSDFARSSQAMKAILYSLGIDLAGANIADGSGLSRYNLLSAHQVLNVLTTVYQHPEYHFLLDTLPESGVSGTLRYKRYFNKSPLKNHVFAKTGSMLGVANLAGKVKASNGHDYLFVLIENGLSPQIKKQQKAPFSAVFLQTMIDVPRNENR
ncbi:D-alanyl-D-alanine carboxypeptidase/D-alanyl-D-alanine endopeptidase [Shewanella inventionis]|uniref:D-alanyl-D-alanine carboxypeptidase n=1 Tax=Shewanella inventionis TaxID=1738770 RepID=A0ABQ1JBY9_9GAMM|nr:D-alanyl-D-alanine carboxypeptidase/D-alanyl-D-alanine-endopeptidase [Shewanella inventionis]MCL1157792.1 D-alanyl-D-alanine carboxypeptidase/D-alanyl-D-alanine-endopeptidase [Shewanella inventionis]GGB63215.1 D-alanyl-D-alanine carboxypeptidase [Shewanella inventionis]